MSFDFNNETPIYLQLIDDIKLQIINKVYLPSQKLPSVRELSVMYEVNPNTIQKAYTELERVENIAMKKPDEEAAFYYKKNVIPKMDALRSVVDAMEVLTAREFWPVPTYGDILFRL